jgi:hypothetical protein
MIRLDKPIFTAMIKKNKKINYYYYQKIEYWVAAQ